MDAIVWFEGVGEGCSGRVVRDGSTVFGFAGLSLDPSRAGLSVFGPWGSVRESTTSFSASGRVRIRWGCGIRMGMLVCRSVRWGGVRLVCRRWAGLWRDYLRKSERGWIVFVRGCWRCSSSWRRIVLRRSSRHGLTGWWRVWVGMCWWGSGLVGLVIGVGQCFAGDCFGG